MNDPTDRPTRCDACRFWKPPHEHGQKGDCRVNPPSVCEVERTGALVVNYGVPTNPDYWCGAWQPLPLAQVTSGVSK